VGFLLLIGKRWWIFARCSRGAGVGFIAEPLRAESAHGSAIIEQRNNLFRRDLSAVERNHGLVWGSFAYWSEAYFVC
jgi:hypothetical protein